MLREAKARFPDARLRRISLPATAGRPVVVRMLQPFEWTPNGRTQLSFDPATGAVLKIEDPATSGTGASIREKFYPVHSAKVGGIAWKLMMTLSGLSLAMLGLFATWSFWVRKAKRRRPRRVSSPSVPLRPSVAPPRALPAHRPGS